MSGNSCPVPIIGIEIHYCDDQGKPQSVMVNMEAVHAIAWEPGVSKPLPSQPGPCRTLPRGRLKDCDRAKEDDHHNLCWWNGNEWVCGEA